MQINQIRRIEWLIGLAVVLLLALYGFWLYHTDHYVRYMRAGAANSIIWRALNAQESDFPDRLSGITDRALYIPRHPAACDTKPETTSFPSKCHNFRDNFGSKAISCSFWWLGRNCRIVYISNIAIAETWLNQRLFTAFKQPCKVLYKPGASGKGQSSTSQYAHEFRTTFRCESLFQLWPFETQFRIRQNGKTIRVQSVWGQ